MTRLAPVLCLLLIAYASAGSIRNVVQKADHPGRVPSEYLVTVRRDDQTQRIVQRINQGINGITIKKIHNFSKISVLVIHSEDESRVANMASVPGVLSVEADVNEYVLACVDQDLTGISGLWNLARTNVRDANGPEAFSYTEGDGAGTTVYVLDTGIYTDHNDFGERAEHLYSVQPYDEEAEFDMNGHGTHCAGTVMGATYGAAKSANAIGVKVVSRFGTGTVAQCIDGLEWTLNDFNAKNAGGQFKAVVSMSLGYSRSSAMDDVIQDISDAGLLTIAAAANARTDACTYSPSGAAASISVAASDSNDALASFTNYGLCVDIIAPGVNVLSAYIGGEDNTATLSGTSMATPLVAGVVCRYLSQVDDTPAPEAIRQYLAQISTKGVIDLNGFNTTPNNFLYQPCDLP